jgi:ectoine hydroxylase-related dioxygenase (phytanoyl-CoA dioxygenase family)
LYVYPPLLDAALRVVGRDFKLSSFGARTLHAGAGVLDIHVDVERDSTDWPLLGFILMVDAFRPDNGATRFLPGSHRWATSPRQAPLQDHATHLVSACGPAGSLLVFNGSTWHGQGVNDSGGPRRSLQGAFVPRGGRAAIDFFLRVSAETRERLGAVAHDVLALRQGPPARLRRFNIAGVMKIAARQAPLASVGSGEAAPQYTQGTRRFVVCVYCA